MKAQKDKNALFARWEVKAMDSASRHERISRAAEILSRYEHTDEDEPEDCEDLPPVTEREELQQIMDLQEAWEAIFDELGG